VTFEVTPWGGHTGFVSGAWPWRPRYWAEELTVDWLGRTGQPTVRAAG
jgi:predicted alpha/beta-fold hydrolase